MGAPEFPGQPVQQSENHPKIRKGKRERERKGKREKGKGKREKGKKGKGKGREGKGISLDMVGMLTGQDRRSSTDSESTAGVTEESSRLA